MCSKSSTPWNELVCTYGDIRFVLMLCFVLMELVCKICVDAVQGLPWIELKIDEI